MTHPTEPRAPRAVRRPRAGAFLASLRLCAALLAGAGWASAGGAAAQMANGQEVTPLADGRRVVGRPFLTNYRPTDYQGHTQNWGIAQDGQGLIYVANGRGVLVYDGAGWDRVRLPNRALARSIAAGADGRVYVGSLGDFGYLAPDSTGRLQFVSLLEHVPESARDFLDVWTTHATPEGVYFNVASRLFRWDGRRMHVWEAETPFHVGFYVNGSYYLRQWDVGLVRMVRTPSGDRLERVPGGERFASMRVYSMLPFGDAGSGDDRILVGTHAGDFFLYDGRSFERFETEADAYLREHGLYHPGVVLPGGRFAFGTVTGGVVVIDRQGHFARQVDRSSGLLDNVVFYVLRDREGALWAALDHGISRIEIVSPLSWFDAGLDLGSNALTMARHEGRLYVGTTIGIVWLDEAAGVFRPVQDAGYQCFDLRSFEGHLLGACADALVRIDGDRTAVIRPTVNNDFQPAYLHAWSRFPGWILAGHARGATALQIDAKGEVVREIPITQTEVVSYLLAEEEDGSVWMGVQGEGVLHIVPAAAPTSAEAIAGARVDRYGAEDGLVEGDVQPFRAGPHLLFETPAGVQRFDERMKRFVPDAMLEPLLASVRRPDEAETLRMHADGLGRIWVAGPRGTYRLIPRGEGGYQPAPGPFARFGRSTIGAILPEVDRGLVWMATDQGLALYDERAMGPDDVPFRALVRRVATGGDRLLFGGYGELSAAVLPHEQNEVRVTFAAPAFTAESELRYRSWLEGFEEQWSEWGTARSRDFTNLPEGSYVFHVRARDVNGRESEPARFAFTILPPWYRTWWAYGVYLLGTVAFLAAGTSMVRRQVIRRERERMRIDLLRADHDRQAHELEQARRLQLAMLPKVVPDLPHVTLAARMLTATEVGGDFYDFEYHPPGTREPETGVLNLVVGDATGHGAEAGVVVASAKGVFSALPFDHDLTDVLREASRIMRRMHFRRLYMAVTVARLRGYELELAGAGMPAALLHRVATGTIESISLKGLPIGSPHDYPYRTHRRTLQPGDTLLLLSDGFPELANPQGEMLGYDRAEALLADVAAQSPEAIIDAFVELASQWSGRPRPNDDMTFVVLRATES